jgi:hypothetical protein
MFSFRSMNKIGTRNLPTRPESARNTWAAAGEFLKRELSQTPGPDPLNLQY